MKSYWTLTHVTIALLLVMTTSTANADELTGRISGFIGMKAMDSGDWPDLNTHFSMGFLFDIKKDSWPISIAVDITDTGDKHKHDGMEDLAHTTEYHLGVRKFFMNRHDKIQPYIGGGISFLYAELEYELTSQTITEDDRGTGGWLGAGMYYEMNPKLVLGIDARYSQGQVSLFNKDRNAGGFHTGVTIGYQF
jgi:opacity protein-like surface antigen